MSKQISTFKHGVPWEESFGYSQGVRVGDTLYVSGQLSHDEEGNFIGEGDFETQVRTTFKNIDKVLNAFGATKKNIVDDTVLVVNLQENSEAVQKLHLEYFEDHHPASTTVGISALAFPEQLVEIRVTARLDLND
ncbi:hypothetical protein COJ01_19910 [Priestia megaterium]|uniref:RidA family protein n=1 Tax=Priestia megaterium TaxID=1404 RepID=UPI000BF55E10|nr:Rid family hydrolase [Priestia megaterium]PFK99257.1 hypothetical protein COJ01_19910 [Priestia megaterium]RCX18970.1 enamine deaminase RidA (YjgF/YER057c/UK114 family) [Bacillus sp. AG236]